MSNESATRHFHIGDILSITGEKLVSPRLIEGVYDICNFMTGDSLFTHQLPRAHDVCGPELLHQHPQLAGVDESSVNSQTWRAWLDEQIAKFGETLSVSPLPEGIWTTIDPILEAESMMGKGRVIALKL